MQFWRRWKRLVLDLSLNPGPHPKFMWSITGWKASCIQICRNPFGHFCVILPTNQPTKKRGWTYDCLGGGNYWSQAVAKFITTDLEGNINIPPSLLRRYPQNKEVNPTVAQERKSAGFIFWEPWMSVQNFMTIPPIFVEVFQSWPTDDRWRGLEIFKWCNRSQSTTPYSSPDVYVLAAPSHLAHSFMHTFSKHCPPTLDPGVTPCEGPASRERSSCPSASPRLITLKQHRGTHKTRSVLACQNEKKITVSPPLVCFIARESSWSSLSRSFWNPCLFKIQSCRQIHRDGSIHMIQTWGNKHPNER